MARKKKPSKTVDKRDLGTVETRHRLTTDPLLSSNIDPHRLQAALAIRAALEDGLSAPGLDMVLIGMGGGASNGERSYIPTTQANLEHLVVELFAIGHGLRQIAAHVHLRRSRVADIVDVGLDLYADMRGYPRCRGRRGSMTNYTNLALNLFEAISPGGKSHPICTDYLSDKLTYELGPLSSVWAKRYLRHDRYIDVTIWAGPGLIFELEIDEAGAWQEHGPKGHELYRLKAFFMGVGSTDGNKETSLLLSEIKTRFDAIPIGDYDVQASEPYSALNPRPFDPTSADAVAYQAMLDGIAKLRRENAAQVCDKHEARIPASSDAALLVSVRTESERKAALARIQDLMSAKPGTPAGDELSRLGEWVLEYDAQQERREEIETIRKETGDQRNTMSSLLKIVNGLMDLTANVGKASTWKAEHARRHPTRSVAVEAAIVVQRDQERLSFDIARQQERKERREAKVFLDGDRLRFVQRRIPPRTPRV